jgi:predicted MPP superfamily phosphohydrolase
MFRNIHSFVITRHKLALPGLDAPLRIAQLSDLHYGVFLFEDAVSAWVDATLGERPDLIVLTGDLADGRSRSPLTPLLDALAPLTAPLGVWSVWGNHDYFNRGTHRQLAAGLRQIGVHTLRNGNANVRPDLMLAGVDDFKLGQPDLRATLAGIPPGVPSLLLTHNPDLLPELEAGQVSLALAGHTHGGQVRLPFIGAPVTSSEYGQRFAQGWVHDPVRAHVSRGLGVTAIPVRLACPPELVILDLLPAEAVSA